VIYNDTAKNIICNTNPRVGGQFVPLGFTGANAFTTVSNCNPNFSATQVGSRTLWNPVPNIDIGFDLAWYHNNTAFAGTAVLPNIPARPAGNYTISNADILSAFFRFQRNFLY